MKEECLGVEVAFTVNCDGSGSFGWSIKMNGSVREETGSYLVPDFYLTSLKPSLVAAL